jgi:hypothetical protein
LAGGRHGLHVAWRGGQSSLLIAGCTGWKEGQRRRHSLCRYRGLLRKVREPFTAVLHSLTAGRPAGFPPAVCGRTETRKRFGGCNGADKRGGFPSIPCGRQRPGYLSDIFFEAALVTKRTASECRGRRIEQTLRLDLGAPTRGTQTHQSNLVKSSLLLHLHIHNSRPLAEHSGIRASRQRCSSAFPGGIIRAISASFALLLARFRFFLLHPSSSSHARRSSRSRTASLRCGESLKVFSALANPRP